MCPLCPRFKPPYVVLSHGPSLYMFHYVALCAIVTASSSALFPT